MSCDDKTLTAVPMIQSGPGRRRRGTNELQAEPHRPSRPPRRLQAADRSLRSCRQRAQSRGIR
jgi:hypothetical protein